MKLVGEGMIFNRETLSSVLQNAMEIIFIIVTVCDEVGW
jgi:hypothetical protein